jgi:hypothetical protein
MQPPYAALCSHLWVLRDALASIPVSPRRGAAAVGTYSVILPKYYKSLF